MLFSSITFLYVFLPIVSLLYLVTKKELHNSILLIASILFYAWGEPKYLAIMLVTIIVNYYGAILIDKFRQTKRKQKAALLGTIIVDLGFLVYFKYFDFIIANINSIFHSQIDLIEVIMPIGISFYTFQALSYLIDVYRGEVKVQKDFYKLALYISLFPQLIAGPIVKYHDIETQIDDRDVTFDKVSLGAKRFIIGLSKKIIIANTLGSVADKIFTQTPDTFSPLIAWLGAICYSFQLFFDFSGYSDMAIGLGLIFGFKFLENFNYPYISKSITEFWRRWHISLSTWFKNYVYISLGGNRKGLLKTLRNLGIVFLLTGIWHGAAWNFVIWGIWNGFFIILEKILGIGKKDEVLSGAKKIFRHIYTILIFVLGWVIFRSDDMAYAFTYLKNMFGMIKVHDVLYSLAYYIDRFEIIILAVAVLCSTPIFSKMLQKSEENKILKTIVNLWLIFLLISSTAFIASSTYNPFIYFRF
ncbi:MAG: MBOAT family protein [Candidatus Gastranaerophilales bacterium]|nr:MBOAT family protein [Candidatus Gastranaerophilales bacterium]